ncbi:AAA family ATPase [Deinococcus reticulitermitis]|uniref:AAA family ATPase n=1 Tax=Deinococcus reticulitermitis TaxID=856736 RepID=UPI0015A624B7|nr:AAA family ATPase [Deinococcus reticulitermitis]
MERLQVKGFAGISNADIQIKQFTIFIGHQASGKSICAKLIYYFRQILSNMALDVSSGSSRTDIKKKHRIDFARYFPEVAWGREAFEISYCLYDFRVSIKSKMNKNRNSITITYSEAYDKMLESLRREVKKYQDDEIEGFFRVIGVDGEERYIDVSPNNLMRELAKKILHEDYSNTNYFVPAGRSFFQH